MPQTSSVISANTRVCSPAPESRAGLERRLEMQTVYRARRPFAGQDSNHRCKAVSRDNMYPS